MSAGGIIITLAVFPLWLAYRLVRYSRLSRRRKLHQARGRNIMEQGITVKEVVRSDGKERVKIFDNASQGFGAALESRVNGEWVFQQLIGPGAVFDSAEVAEREAGTELSWLGSHGRKSL